MGCAHGALHCLQKIIVAKPTVVTFFPKIGITILILQKYDESANKIFTTAEMTQKQTLNNRMHKKSLEKYPNPF